jgi:hypothetical protein
MARAPIVLARDLPLSAGRGTAIGVPRALRRGEGVQARLRDTPTLSVGGAIRVARALEEFGFVGFEESVHYHGHAMGEVARTLDITVSGGEQT